MDINTQELIQEKIKSFLKKKGRASSSEIAKQIKHNRITVTKYLEVMKAHGLLECEDIAQARLWSLSDKNFMKKILVVDDEPHIVQLVKLSLLNPKLEIIEAYSGFDALEKVKLHNPDLIVLDLMMPGLSGFEVCRKLKSEAIYQHIPIIILSAKNELQDKIKGLNVGADDYVTKPFDPIEFEARVNSLINSLENEMDFNPNTGLPGKTALISYLSDIKNKNLFIYKIKINGFNKFNKEYGFKKGNDLLVFLSRMINEKNLEDDCLRAYHLMNDLFVVVSLKSDFIDDFNSSFKKMLPFIYSGIETKNKIKLDVELVNKSHKFKNINLIIKKLEEGVVK